MRNPALEPLDVIVGDWSLTLTNAWFIDDAELPKRGRASIRWIGEAFVELTGHVDQLDEVPTWHFVVGRSDANDQCVALYHDPRPTSRLFQVEVTEGRWRMWREDPDFHQRFDARFDRDRIEARFEASEDAGATWRTDFDLLFERVSG